MLPCRCLVTSRHAGSDTLYYASEELLHTQHNAAVLASKVLAVISFLFWAVPSKHNDRLVPAAPCVHPVCDYGCCWALLLLLAVVRVPPCLFPASADRPCRVGKTSLRNSLQTANPEWSVGKIWRTRWYTAASKYLNVMLLSEVTLCCL